MQYYLGLIHSGENGYGIPFPDFPGCISAGDTLDETLREGAKALAFHTEGMCEDGEAIPTPRSIGLGAAWNISHLQGHGITFGATRSGKGVQSIIPALLSYAGSMVVIDPKGENAWATAERRRQMGQRVVSRELVCPRPLPCEV